MKILHFCSSIGKQSGVMKVITEYHKYLYHKYDISFDYMYWDDDLVDYSKEIEAWGGQLIKINKPTIKAYKVFKEEINQISKEYDIMHIHELYLIRFIDNVLRINNCKIVAHAHTTEFSDKLLGKVRNKILCMGLKDRVDIQVASSLSAGELYFTKKFIDVGEILPNILTITDYSFNDEIRIKYRKQMKLENKTVILHVGRFNDQKNHDKLINIFNEYLKLDDKAILLTVGEGPLKNKYKEYVREQELSDNILFLDTRSDINKIMMASDIFLFPSLFEGLGIALVEAQYTGLYCICSDIIPEEAFIMDDVLRLNLEQSSKYWAEKIYKNLTLAEKNRNQKSLPIISTVFDSKQSGDNMLKLYKGVFYE